MDKIALVLFLCFLVVPSHSRASSEYMDAVKQELARLNNTFLCNEVSLKCEVVSESYSETIVIVLNDETSTVRMIISNLFYLPVTGLTENLARKVIEINNELICARLIWNKRANSIDISAVINTDSNFDRKAFRSVFKGLIQSAKSIKEDFQNNFNDN